MNVCCVCFSLSSLLVWDFSIGLYGGFNIHVFMIKLPSTNRYIYIYDEQ